MQRAGVGTSPEMASPGAERPSVDHRDGCRGFTGPFPPPLWMSNMKLLSRILTDSLADVPAGPRPARRPVQAAPHHGLTTDTFLRVRRKMSGIMQRSRPARVGGAGQDHRGRYTAGTARGVNLPAWAMRLPGAGSSCRPTTGPSH